MSQPKTDYNSPIQGAMAEICHAMSALNMPHESIPGTESLDARLVYMTEVSKWPKHAYEHLEAAFEILLKLLHPHVQAQEPAIKGEWK